MAIDLRSAATTALVSRFPCTTCAKLLVQSGVCNLVTREPDMQNAKWKQEFALARELMLESGMTLTEILSVPQ